MKEQLRAVIYIRVSTDEQAENGTSLADQREQCLRYAELRGALVVEVCEDAGVSGAKYEHRPGIQRAVSLVESGKADTLIATKIDRLSRKMKALADIAERVDRAGGQIVTCDGNEYGKTPTGRLMLNMLGSFAEFERDTFRDRSERGHARRAMEGKQPNRSFRPFGYHIVTEADVKAHKYPANMAGEYIILEEEARWVRDMFQQMASGTSLRQIEKWLAKNSVPTARGGQHWYAKTVANILSNPVYKGSAVFGKTRTYHDENLLKQGFRSDERKKARPEDEWILIPVEPLVSEEVWNICQNQLKRNKEMYGGNRGRKFMLSSMAYCPHCGWKWVGWNRRYPHRPGWESPVYLCHNEYADCNRKCISTAMLEDVVVRMLLWASENPDLIAQAIRAYDHHNRGNGGSQREGEQALLKKELADIERDLDATKKTMMTAIRAGLSESDFIADFERLAARRKRVEARLSELSTADATRPNAEPLTEAQKYANAIRAVKTVLTASNEEYPPTDKQRFIATIVDRIEPTFDRTTVTVTLRTETVYTVNAAYWYRRAGKAVASGDFEAEWDAIASSLLAE